ncbi:unnamed protein product [Mesocestoides corti]|uniref:Anoctamin n=1 Tax=Mesocestoides corti TaxID=53468 RepID=A0A0R3UB54_MESCO|nr:unnamed protein product [Mesocestoides corti]
MRCLGGWNQSAFKPEKVAALYYPVLAFCTMLWAVFFQESWKRSNNHYTHHWGTLDKLPSLLEEPRPLFRGTLEPSPITGRLEPFYPRWKRNLIVCFVTLPITLLCLTVVVVVALAHIKLQEYAENRVAKCRFRVAALVPFLPMILYALNISILNAIYRKIAAYLTDLENHRLSESHEFAFVSKLILFQFINAFYAPFYIAFYRMDLDHLRHVTSFVRNPRSVEFVDVMFRVEALATRQHVHLVALLFLQHLMTILVTRQIMGNLKEVFLPLGQTRIRQVYLSLRADGFALLKREDDATAPPPQVFTTSSDVDDGENSLEGSSTRMRRNAGGCWFFVEAYRSDPRSSDTSLLPVVDAKVHRDIGFTRAEQEEIMPKYDDATDDYLEMFIQFGFVSMFTCAFPICGLLAFLNNLLEIRSDAFKLLTNFQRPFAETATGIGVWERAFDIVSYVAISVNIGLIGVSGSLQDVFPGLTPYQHALLLISIEHILFVLRFGLSHVVPPVPLALETSIAILEHKRREALRTVEREGRKEARKVSEGNDSQASYEYPEYQNSDIDTP